MSILEKYPDLQNDIYVAAYVFVSCPTYSDKKGPIFELDVAAALLNTEGNISRAARLVGRSRRSVETYIARNADLGDLQEDIESEFIDEAETRLKGIATAGDIGTLKFLMQTKGRSRGYVTRSEVTGKDGDGLNVVFYLPENGRDPKPKDE